MTPQQLLKRAAWKSKCFAENLYSQACCFLRLCSQDDKRHLFEWVRQWPADWLFGFLPSRPILGQNKLSQPAIPPIDTFSLTFNWILKNKTEACPRDLELDRGAAEAGAWQNNNYLPAIEKSFPFRFPPTFISNGAFALCSSKRFSPEIVAIYDLIYVRFKCRQLAALLGACCRI